MQVNTTDMKNHYKALMTQAVFAQWVSGLFLASLTGFAIYANLNIPHVFAIIVAVIGVGVIDGVFLSSLNISANNILNKKKWVFPTIIAIVFGGMSLGSSDWAGIFIGQKSIDTHVNTSKYTNVFKGAKTYKAPALIFTKTNAVVNSMYNHKPSRRALMKWVKTGVPNYTSKKVGPKKRAKIKAAYNADIKAYKESMALYRSNMANATKESIAQSKAIKSIAELDKANMQTKLKKQSAMIFTIRTLNYVAWLIVVLSTFTIYKLEKEGVTIIRVKSEMHIITNIILAMKNSLLSIVEIVIRMDLNGDGQIGFRLPQLNIPAIAAPSRRNRHIVANGATRDNLPFIPKRNIKAQQPQPQHAPPFEPKSNRVATATPQTIDNQYRNSATQQAQHDTATAQRNRRNSEPQQAQHVERNTATVAQHESATHGEESATRGEEGATLDIERTKKDITPNVMPAYSRLVMAASVADLKRLLFNGQEGAGDKIEELSQKKPNSIRAIKARYLDRGDLMNFMIASVAQHQRKSNWKNAILADIKTFSNKN